MKRFILDTCIFIDDPDCIFKFEENEVVVPFKVLEELDKHKESPGSRGEGARSSLRNIYNLTPKGKLSKGVKMDNGGFFRIDTVDPHSIKLPFALDLTDSDNVILAVAYSNKKKRDKKETVLITNDINLKIKSESIDIPTEKYENRSVKKAEHLFAPYQLVELETADLDAYVKTGFREKPEETKLYSNQFVLFKNKYNKQSALGRYNSSNNHVEKLFFHEKEPFGIRGRNLEQRFAMDLLMDDHCKLVSLLGKAGTGKTILALAVGLHKVLIEREYSKIVVARPIVALSKSHDIGFLPGSLDEKLMPWMQPIMDNLEIILSNSEENTENELKQLMESRKLEFSALAYIRGRSIENAFIIIDEAQQLLPRESKAVLTRVGEHSKIVLSGDPYQTDHAYLDETTNGLSYVVEKFKKEQIAGHAVLTKCERSSLASIAADIL